MSTLAASRPATAVHVLLLAAMAGLFATGAAAQKPAGVRTALELIDRKWLRDSRATAIGACSAAAVPMTRCSRPG